MTAILSLQMQNDDFQERTTERQLDLMTWMSQMPRCLSSIVLIVEDEALIRLDATDMLASAGFRVLEAANADEAIAILESRSDIAVVFTDIQMPGSMDGVRLAAAVRGRWPPIKVIATSGRAAAFRSELPEGTEFLAKPYAARELTTAVKETLASVRH